MNTPRFSIIPAGAVTDRSLEPRDLQTLCLLGRHTDKAGWCTRSQVRMAQELDCARSSVQRSLDRLYEAGWVEMKRRDTTVAAEGGRPSASHAYRVRLDRDDYAFESVMRDSEDTPEESYAKTASEEGGCPPVGTLSEEVFDSQIAAGNSAEGAQKDGHPGAHPYVGTGAHPYVGTKNVPLERSPIERERDARARDRKARFLVSFEARWPTAAADDRQRTAYAAESLTEAEEEPALGGIAPFLDHLKRLGRKNVPAGWRYLEEKRWTLLEQPAPAGAEAKPNTFEANSAEGKALLSLYAVARTRPFESGRRLVYPGEITAAVLAFGNAGDRSSWLWIEDRKQIGAWSGFLGAHVFGARPQLLTDRGIGADKRSGIYAPWPWPPSAEGKIYTTGPPEALMSDQDFADFK